LSSVTSSDLEIRDLSENESSEEMIPHVRVDEGSANPVDNLSAIKDEDSLLEY